MDMLSPRELTEGKDFYQSFGACHSEWPNLGVATAKYYLQS